MIIADNNALAELGAELTGHQAIGLDTELLRERTYYAQLCLLQLSWPAGTACVDTLALPDLSPLRASLADPRCCKVLHAARQDLEVLWPATGPITGIFDTQVAAALVGLPAQIGYADLVQQLLDVSLSKAQTRTDWSRRPLSAAQISYAVDDVRYLLPLRERLTEQLQRLQRFGWFEEEMAQLGAGGSFEIDPERAWLRVKGLTELDPQRRLLAQSLAAWRERRAVSADRPRAWILPDAAVRDIVLQVPRSRQDLQAIAELPEGIRNNSGAQLLEVIEAAQLPPQLPPLPPRRRPDPAQIETVRRLAEVTQRAGRELGLAPEILATRRDMERLAAGEREGGPLSGWRREVIGQRLLQAL
ncbi:MAG: ribonuclease D [Steroidobacterales bacterium]